MQAALEMGNSLLSCHFFFLLFAYTDLKRVLPGVALKRQGDESPYHFVTISLVVLTELLVTFLQVRVILVL
jgi:hypothetical protein